MSSPAVAEVKLSNPSNKNVLRLQVETAEPMKPANDATIALELANDAAIAPEAHSDAENIAVQPPSLTSSSDSSDADASTENSENLSGGATPDDSDSSQAQNVFNPTPQQFLSLFKQPKKKSTTKAPAVRNNWRRNSLPKKTKPKQSSLASVPGVRQLLLQDCLSSMGTCNDDLS